MPSLHVFGFYLGSHLFSNISYVNIFEKNLLFANGNRYLKKKLSSAWVKQHFSKQRYRTNSGPSKHELWISVLYILDTTNLNEYYNPKKGPNFSKRRTSLPPAPNSNKLHVYMSNFPF